MTRIEGAIVCLGEVVWDLFADGPGLGGAPFNSAVHLKRHGVPVALVTAVGRDPLGEAILAFLHAEALPGARIHPSLPTGTVQVALDGQGTPRFAIQERAAWTDLAGAAPRAGDPAPLRPALLVFGGVAMHSDGNRKLATRLGNAAPLRLCDLNLRPGWADPEVARWCLAHADILKVNADELAFLLALEGLDRPETLLEHSGLQGLCVTLGPGGLIWRDRSGPPRQLPAAAEGDPGPVVDTVGAGDAITAALALGLVSAEPPEVFLDRARTWAARVCAVRGALLPRD